VGNELGLMECHDDSPRAAEFVGYGRKPEPRKMLRALDMFMRRRPSKTFYPGDVLLMRFDEDPQHLAILTEEGTIIHALYSLGKVVEHRLSAQWRSRVVAAWSYDVG
jgi:cell wall-associated NlpC family hydrolase